jgi:hypothetical protein
MYLNVEELNSIENLDLNDEVFEYCRDIFLIGCNTGLRISMYYPYLKNNYSNI